jgi:putative transcriptional regulator
MPSHPNRGKSPGANPTPAQVLAAREAAGHSQLDAAELIFGSERGWQEYEAGRRRMHPAIWTWYLVATGQHPRLIVVERKAPRKG